MILIQICADGPEMLQCFFCISSQIKQIQENFVSVYKESPAVYLEGTFRIIKGIKTGMSMIRDNGHV